MKCLNPYLDALGNTQNGWNSYKYDNTFSEFQWRYANKEEINAYNEVGKPVLVDNKFIQDYTYLIELFKKLGIN